MLPKQRSCDATDGCLRRCRSIVRPLTASWRRPSDCPVLGAWYVRTLVHCQNARDFKPMLSLGGEKEDFNSWTVLSIITWSRFLGPTSLGRGPVYCYALIAPPPALFMAHRQWPPSCSSRTGMPGRREPCSIF